MGLITRECRIGAQAGYIYKHEHKARDRLHSNGHLGMDGMCVAMLPDSELHYTVNHM